MEHEFFGTTNGKPTEIGFHKDDTNAFLKDNLQSLALSPETTIFLAPYAAKL